MTNEEFIESISLPGEEWRDVVGYETRYCVSSFGRVITKSTPFKQGNYCCTPKPKLRKTAPNNSGYPSISLSDGEKHVKRFLVHRLVANAFIPNPNELPSINHIDENPGNNHVKNLEWCTYKYNVNYGTHTERMAKSLRESTSCKKMVIQLSLDCKPVQTFDSASNAARFLGVDMSNIVRCCNGIYQSVKGFKWAYLSNYESLINKSKN